MIVSGTIGQIPAELLKNVLVVDHGLYENPYGTFDLDVTGHTRGRLLGAVIHRILPRAANSTSRPVVEARLLQRKA